MKSRASREKLFVQEASGWPTDVNTEEEKDAYIESYRQVSVVH